MMNTNNKKEISLSKVIENFNNIKIDDNDEHFKISFQLIREGGVACILRNSKMIGSMSQCKDWD